MLYELNKVNINIFTKEIFLLWVILKNTEAEEKLAQKKEELEKETKENRTNSKYNIIL